MNTNQQPSESNHFFRYVGLGVTAIIALLIFCAFFGGYFIVNPGTVAYVRRLGTVTTDKPYTQGWYTKVPFITSVDHCSIAMQNLKVPQFTVTTVDNQIVTLDVNISYTAPISSVHHLLYEVGAAGGGDIHENILPILKDRVARIFAGQNTNSFNANRNKVQTEIELSVREHLKELFQVEVNALQFANVQFSDAFMRSNAEAVLSKNMAVKEENEVNVRKFQGQQRVIAAKADADVIAAAAEGQARSVTFAAEAESKRLELVAQGQAKATILAADADKQTRELKGKGDGLGLEYIIKAVGGADKYANILAAQAQNRWSGKYPENYMTFGTAPALVNIPALKAATDKP